jgi:hypothetical protein
MRAKPTAMRSPVARFTSTLCVRAPLTPRLKNILSALTPRQAASEIANAFQSAAPDVWAMSKAASGVVDADGELFDRLARDVVLQFGARLAVMHVSEIAAYLYSDRWLHVAFDLYEDDDAEGAETDFQPALRVPKRKGFILPAATQRPPHFPIPAYNLPRIDNVNDLATLLGVICSALMHGRAAFAHHRNTGHHSTPILDIGEQRPVVVRA